MSQRLWAWSGFAAILSGAGLPIYIYAPKFYADTYGTSLTALGIVLFGLRILDFVQDPALGWLAERIRQGRAIWVSLVAVLLALSMLGLFAVAPPVAPLLWFAVTITGLFSAFSFLTIAFYARGVEKAAGLSGSHVRLAAWRESGALAGVCIAAVAPTALGYATDAPFAVFAWGFAAATLLATLAMLPEWRGRARTEPAPIRAILGDRPVRRLLLLALVNAMPLAVTSTLFLFYVESRLAAPGWEGALLVLFFLAAAASAPGWSALSGRYGPKPVLLGAMTLAIASFAVTLGLGPGDQAIFAAICVVSGAAIGADLTLMPALFAARMAEVAPNGGQGFGLWSLVNKMTLAIAAAVLLPALDLAGFVSGGENPEAALTALTLLYAGCPIVLKIAAMVLLTRLPLDGFATGEGLGRAAP
ncbi:MFS transporter [Histidinibacterium aquaticum]|uniref:Sugar:cation symporter n=1 Tax=Histidinibacterium aquaticum TaxID=2613962 RepID=A0A5J5GCY5_9RHOB|nr:MFS transporter [Histidinibacterium aquaticum]KAA9006049.1 sugar:cation symporter [Histidinibacterium aquaticum]